ncbi:MAG TPA: hypothetical protein VMW31_00815, partial [Devosiaceae bacterium]|nr:hypothetical protein [Devosiaceae bacterium]
MPRALFVKFEELNAPMALVGCGEVLDTLGGVVPRWPLQVATSPSQGQEPFVTVERTADGYRLGSKFMAEPAVQVDTVNAVCALVVEMAWALLRSRPNLLCLHGAAAEFTGSLVVLPNGRKAGKSVLTACLAAAGHRVFTDDFLPLDVDAGGLVQGIACGAAARLRLPLPDDLAPETAAWIADHAGPANAQYQYLDLPARGLAPHGARLPIGAIVLLARQKGATARIEPVGGEAVLECLMVQNFARSGRAERVTQTLRDLAASTRGLRLVYDRAEDAAALMQAEFDVWPEARSLPPERPRARPAPVEATPAADAEPEPAPALQMQAGHAGPAPEYDPQTAYQQAPEYDPQTAYQQTPGV